MTLSAFCPTAASLLFDDAPFAIVTMEDGRRYEGLDATNVLPPLLREGMLMDWPGVATWEELAIATLSAHRHDAEHALQVIESASQEVCEHWQPDLGPLSQALEAAFSRTGTGTGTRTRTRTEPAEPMEPMEPMEPAVSRFLSSHAFANWEMYRGRGIRGALEALKRARAALDEERGSWPLKEAMRQADLRLRHSVF